MMSKTVSCAENNMALVSMRTRRSVPPALLSQPAPDHHELMGILNVASRVPDHGMLIPWRFVLVQGEQTEELLQAFLDHHKREEEDPALIKAMRSRLTKWMVGPPLIVFLIWRHTRTDDFPELDQLLSAGAVATSFLHAVHASGYASIWLTGWPCLSNAGAEIFQLEDNERLIGLFPVGTAIKRPAERARPDINSLVSNWRS